ncbi:MAG: rod shape-determining protein MreC [Oscillatoria sp. Prado101]|jgi:rod shape-determining protein MreC|nr:rod shape-determining protein MreC [Oscillatoria sp. Prado101]
MYTLRRWWDRHGLQMALAVMAIGAAVAVQQSQGSIIFEVFQTVTRPFDLSPNLEEQRQKARMLAGEERLVELEKQNEQLKKLLGYVSTKSDPGVVAPVVGRSADHWWQQVTLGRGRKDGIKKGYIVTGPGGLIGRIDAVTDHTSRVLLISDPSSRVGVTVSRSRNMGFMRGQGANRAVMEFFDKVPDVRKDDVVATSPVSELFVPGIPVGRIESVNLSKSPAPEAIVELSAPVNALEWVVVSQNKPIPEIDISSQQRQNETNSSN